MVLKALPPPLRWSGSGRHGYDNVSWGAKINPHVQPLWLLFSSPISGFTRCVLHVVRSGPRSWKAAGRCTVLLRPTRTAAGPNLDLLDWPPKSHHSIFLKCTQCPWLAALLWALFASWGKSFGFSTLIHKTGVIKHSACSMYFEIFHYRMFWEQQREQSQVFVWSGSTFFM